MQLQINPARSVKYQIGFSHRGNVKKSIGFTAWLCGLLYNCLKAFSDAQNKGSMVINKQ
jgi:hypothetical protein